jgi:hypothetical protein
MATTRAPQIGDMVHYMAGASDCAAVITLLAYHAAMPPNTVEITPAIYAPKQAILVLASMQQPYWAEGRYSEAMEPGSWHWADLHTPPPPPPPLAIEQLYIGMIVHYANQPFLHQPAIICAIVSNRLDLAIMNSDKRRVDFAFGVPEDMALKSNTWHRIRSTEFVEPRDGRSP